MITPKVKKVLLVCFSIFTILAAITIFLTILLRPIIDKALRYQVSTLLKGVYKFDFTTLELNLITGSITLNNVSLIPIEENIRNTYLQENLYSIAVTKVNVDGINYLPFFKRKLEIGEIEIVRPVVSISNGKNPTKNNKKINFYSLIEKQIKNLHINHIHITGGMFQLLKPNEADVRFTIKNFYAELFNLKIDSAIAAKNVGWPDWENLHVKSIKNHYILPDKRHHLDIPKLSWTDRDCVLVISNIFFYEKSMENKAKLSIAITELKGEQIDLQALLKGEIKINKIFLSEPQTTIVIPENAVSQKAPNLKNILIQNFPLTDISAINIVNGNLIVDNKKKNYKIFVDGFNQKFDSIHVNLPNTNAALFEKPSLAFNAKAIKIIFPDSMYVFLGKDLKVDKVRDEVTIKTVSLIPQYNKKEFARRKKFQEERIEINCQDFKLKGIDIYDILLEQRLVASSIEISKFNLEAFRDKNYPEVKKIKLLPHVLLAQLDTDIKIDYLKIYHAEINYEEKLPENKGTNRVYFTNLNATMYNITNEKSASLKPLKLQASGYLFGKGFIQMNGDFTLNSKIGKFTLSGSSKSFDMTYMNSIVETSALSINTGIVDEMTFNLIGNDKLSVGSMNLKYHDLKLDLINRKTSTKHGFKAEVGSFLLDKMLIKSENPSKHGDFRMGEILVERDRYKSIFNFLSKSLLSGVLSTVAPAVSEIKRRKEKGKH